MPSFLRRSAADAAAALCLALGIGLILASDRVLASGAPAPAELQLEVIINGASTNSIGSFVRFDNGRIAATAAELMDLGIRAGTATDGAALVGLDDVPTASYKYDERTQQLFITIDDKQRIPHEYDINRLDHTAAAAPTSWGAVLNHNLFLTSAPFAGALALDGRVFGPFGTFSQSAFVRVDDSFQINPFRLDTNYRYSDPQRLIVYQAGDLITGGLPWTRPIRVGGVQAKKNFALRPDLITVPLPGLSGTAAVPSTVDVYINNVKMFSQEVGAGPFAFSDFPVITGAGDARIVVRDASGRETTTTVPFYSAPQLLKPGLTSFSVEAGLPRVDFGTATDSYLLSPVATASIRRGVFDWLTGEGHVEGGADLVNAGLGAVASVGHYATVSGAITASAARGEVGAQTYLAVETRLFGLNVNVSSLHTFGAYGDLAADVAPLHGLGSAASALRSLDRFTVGTTLPFDRKASVSASFLHGVDGAGTRSDILSASWSRSLPKNGSIFATAFTDFADRSRSGVFAGFSRQFDAGVTGWASVASGSGGTTASIDAVKPLAASVGAFGWHVQDSEGAAASRQASLAYRAPWARLQASVGQTQNEFRGTFDMEGSVATLGGGVFFANRIDDAFAVVRVGVPDVPVLYDNRPIGVTNAQGMILIPSLRSYDRNKITIDPVDLPVDADITTTRTIVAPADRAGILVDFAVRTATSSAVVVFTRPDGSVVPVGASGKSESGEEFIVGYDGQSFLRTLAPQNVVVIETPQGSCRAHFAFAPRPGEQVIISPVVCTPAAADAPPA